MSTYPNNKSLVSCLIWQINYSSNHDGDYWYQGTWYKRDSNIRYAADTYFRHIQHYDNYINNLNL